MFRKVYNYTTVIVYCSRTGHITTQMYSNRNILKKSEAENGAILRSLKINGCAICGYNKCVDCLEFHHVEPKYKRFNVRKSTITRKGLVDELAKCILLCPNCHKEIHFKEVEK